jgi:hypothetical protein
MNETEIFVGLASRVANLCFDGRIPADHTFFIAAILRAFVAETLPDAVRARFAFGLAQACDCLYREQTEWKN